MSNFKIMLVGAVNEALTIDKTCKFHTFIFNRVRVSNWVSLIIRVGDWVSRKLGGLKIEKTIEWVSKQLSDD